MRPVKSSTRKPANAAGELDSAAIVRFHGRSNQDANNQIIFVDGYEKQGMVCRRLVGRRIIQAWHVQVRAIFQRAAGALKHYDLPSDMRAPLESKTATAPYFSKIGLILLASPTATNCTASGFRYLRATRCTSSAVTAIIRLA